MSKKKKRKKYSKDERYELLRRGLTFQLPTKRLPPPPGCVEVFEITETADGGWAVIDRALTAEAALAKFEKLAKNRVSTTGWVRRRMRITSVAVIFIEKQCYAIRKRPIKFDFEPLHPDQLLGKENATAERRTEKGAAAG